MEKWVLYALIAMVFAGCTSVIAKLGLTDISGELGLAVRTVFVFALVIPFALLTVPQQELARLGPQQVGWLAASGLTTAISWVFYYKALKLGEVSTVALIDKGSFVVAIVLAWWLLKEPVTLRTWLGAGLILAGLFVVARR